MNRSSRFPITPQSERATTRGMSRRRALKYLAGGAASLAVSPLLTSPAMGSSLFGAGRESITLALVGGAHIHAPDFVNRMSDHPRVSTKYIWDPNRETASARQEVAGGEIVDSPDVIYGDPEVDGIVVGTETVRHMDVVLPAIENGKHLFVEKPVGMDGREAREIADRVEEAGLIFQTGYFMRSNGVNRTVKEWIDSGKLGDITRLRLSNVHSGAIGGWFDGEWNWMTDPEQAGVGAFGDLGCHVADLLLWFMEEDQPVSCTAHIDTVLDRYPDCDEYGEGMVRFESGAVATIAGGWVDHANPNHLEVSGTKGHLRVTNGELFIQAPDEGASGSEPWGEKKEDLAHPLELFFEAVAGEPDRPLITADEAADVNHLITQMYAAHDKSTWVDL